MPTTRGVNIRVTTDTEQRTRFTRSHWERERAEGASRKPPLGADAIAAFVDRVPHSCMSYEDNVKRLARKFAVHSPVQYDQIFIDGHPIGHPMMTEKANEILCWLAWSLHDLEEVIRSASRDAESSRNT